MANIFPRYSNYIPFKIAVCIGFLLMGILAAFNYYATPKAQVVGYTPEQPIPYDHELHVNQLGLDCRHCHSNVERSGHANVPTAQVCANCHHPQYGGIKSDSPRLAPLMAAIDEKKPIRWVKVHNLSGYAYFDHSAHVGKGVSCVECHGEVDKMRTVSHVKSLSMGFCLECHRSPENHIRPLEEVYNLQYKAKDYLQNNPKAKDAVASFLENHQEKSAEEVEEILGSEHGAQRAFGGMLKEHWAVRPKESCFTCHR